MDYSTSTPATKCSCPPELHRLGIRLRIAQSGDTQLVDLMARAAVKLGYTSWATASVAIDLADVPRDGIALTRYLLTRRMS
jgi:hypothetical protein